MKRIPVRSKSPAASAPRKRPILSTVIARHRKALLEQMAGAIKDQAPERIHKVRVGTRRLQTALDLVPNQGLKRTIRSLKSRLRGLRREVSGARDYDVFLSVLDQAGAEASDEEREKLSPLRELLAKRREGLANRARKALEVFEMAPIRLPIAGAQVRTRASKRLAARTRVFLKRTEEVTDWSDVRAIHQIRIQAKRLRYLLETLAELGYGDSKAAISWLREAQGRIGEWHDLQALEQEVIRLVRKKRFLRGRLSEAAGLLRAASLLSRRKESLAASSFPIKAPSYFRPTLLRMAGRLRG